ncbi:hypothetical protein LG3211_1989 [Lysobacter gummosus]|nr:hypothetical protein LG3211_1989 [Lysobacter gummosus]
MDTAFGHCDTGLGFGRRREDGARGWASDDAQPVPGCASMTRG